MADTLPIQLIKLRVINNALTQTGNSPCVYEDGSDEWISASMAYDRMLPVVMSRHNWKFATKTFDLTSVGVSAFPGYSTIFDLPADCLHLMNVWDKYYGSQIKASDYSTPSPSQRRVPPLDYRVIGNQVHCTPNASAALGVTALYVPVPVEGSPGWPVGFIETLTNEVAALVAFGLNEDRALAADAKSFARDELMHARAADAQQEPRRAVFRSRMSEARRIRRGNITR